MAKKRKPHLDPIRVPVTVSSGAVTGGVSAWRYANQPTVIYISINGAVLKLDAARGA